MKRGLFLSFFIWIAIALGFVALMRVWFTPRSWILGIAFLIGWAAINAFLNTTAATVAPPAAINPIQGTIKPAAAPCSVPP